MQCPESFTKPYVSTLFLQNSIVCACQGHHDRVKSCPFNQLLQHMRSFGPISVLIETHQDRRFVGMLVCGFRKPLELLDWHDTLVNSLALS